MDDRDEGEFCIGSQFSLNCHVLRAHKLEGEGELCIGSQFSYPCIYNRVRKVYLTSTFPNVEKRISKIPLLQQKNATNSDIMSNISVAV
jgi:hypothetical protein